MSAICWWAQKTMANSQDFSQDEETSHICIIYEHFLHPSISISISPSSLPLSYSVCLFTFIAFLCQLLNSEASCLSSLNANNGKNYCSAICAAFYPFVGSHRLLLSQLWKLQDFSLFPLHLNFFIRLIKNVWMWHELLFDDVAFGAFFSRWFALVCCNTWRMRVECFIAAR